jgi:hypothetical protein
LRRARGLACGAGLLELLTFRAQAPFYRLLEILTILENLTSTGSLKLSTLHSSVLSSHRAPPHFVTAAPNRGRLQQR